MDIEKIFQECNPNILGQVQASSLIEWLCTNVKSDRMLEDFQKLLDPDGVNTLVNQEQFESCMRTWLSSHKSCILHDDCRARHDSAASSDAVLNFSSGTLETSNHSFTGDEDIYATCCCHDENELRSKNDEIERKNRILSVKVKDLQKINTNLSEDYAELSDSYKAFKDDLARNETKMQKLHWLHTECDHLKEELEAKEARSLVLEKELLLMMKKLSVKEQELREYMFSKDDTFSEVETLKSELEIAEEKISSLSTLLKHCEDDKKLLIEIDAENANKIKKLESKLEMQTSKLMDMKKEKDDRYAKLAVNYRTLMAEVVENASLNESLDLSVGINGELEYASLHMEELANQILLEKCGPSLFSEMKSFNVEKDDKEIQCDLLLHENPRDCKIFETSVVFVETAARPLSPIHLTVPIPYGNGDEAWTHQIVTDDENLSKNCSNGLTPKRTLRRLEQYTPVTSTPLPPEVIKFDDLEQPPSLSYINHFGDCGGSPCPSTNSDCVMLIECPDCLTRRRVSSTATMTEKIKTSSTSCQVEPSRPAVPTRQRNRRLQQQSVRTQTEFSAVKQKRVSSRASQTEFSAVEQKRVSSRASQTEFSAVEQKRVSSRVSQTEFSAVKQKRVSSRASQTEFSAVEQKCVSSRVSQTEFSAVEQKCVSSRVSQTEFSAVEQKCVSSRVSQTESVGSFVSRKRCRFSQDLEPESKKSQNKMERSSQTDLTSPDLGIIEMEKWLNNSLISNSSHSELLMNDQAALDMKTNVRNGNYLQLQRLLNSMPPAVESPCAEWNTSNCFDTEMAESSKMVPLSLQELEYRTEEEEDMRLPVVAENISRPTSMWYSTVCIVRWMIEQIYAFLQAHEDFVVIMLRCVLVLALLLYCVWCICIQLVPSHMHPCRSAIVCSFPIFKVNHRAHLPT